MATIARDYAHVRELKDLNSHLVEEVEQFFVNYNAAERKRFTVLSRKASAAARMLFERAAIS